MEAMNFARFTGPRVPVPPSLPPEAPLAMPEQALDNWPTAAHDTSADPLLRQRRSWVAVGTFGITATGTVALWRVFAPNGLSLVEALLMLLFVLNFVWIALAFCSALLGLRPLLQNDPAAGLNPPLPVGVPLPGRIALLMPAYNEDPARVFGAIESIWTSLRNTGALDAFDFFILSDSTDPNHWLDEEARWLRLCRKLDAGGRLFYRRRHRNVARKAGNIAEFCTRWGGRYEQMLVLDADSLMTGETILMLARLMATNPRAGLLQTVPRLVNRHTLFARTQQFASAVYGPLLARGFAAWYGADSNYWGHNALVRVRAFADSAGLPVLPGKAPFGGHILSHDFVEAALLRRAGWEVHLLPQLEGSYEESPPSMLDHAQRDRRWCQGNLQHLALLRARGLLPLSRLHLFSGAMAYLSSPLWFAFILLGLAAAVQGNWQLPTYFFPDHTPYPVWQVIDAELSARLFLATLGLLLAPKLLAWLAIACRPALAAAHGGRLRVLASVLLETLLSALSAPIQMLLHTRAVAEVLLGIDSGWNTQNREDRGTPFAECWRRHAGHLAIGMVLAALSYLAEPALLPWMVPTALGLVLAPWVSWAGARRGLGERLARAGLLLTPEELRPPLVVAGLPDGGKPPGDALDRLRREPALQALHLELLKRYPPPDETDAMLLARFRVQQATVGGVAPMLERSMRLAALSDLQTLQVLQAAGGGHPAGGTNSEDKPIAAANASS